MERKKEMRRRGRRRTSKEEEKTKKKKKKIVSVNDSSKERMVKEELIRLTKLVRAKYRDLRRDTEEVERYITSSSKPIVESIRLTMGSSPSSSAIKTEPIEEVRQVKSESVRRKKKKEGEDEGEHDKTMESSVQTEPELVERFLARVGDRSYRHLLDSTYGVRADGKGGLVIGDSAVVFTKSKLQVKDQKFEVTPGLMELLFMKEPDETVINQDDKLKYKNILLLTNAHRLMYSAERAINATRGRKYVSVISKLFPPLSRERSQSMEGSGIRSISKASSINGLVNRLRLLTLSKAAGHTAHGGEISDILGLLRIYKIIA